MDKVVAFNIPTKDMDRSARFYREVFGWNIREVEGSPHYLRAETVGKLEDSPLEPGAIDGGLFLKGTNNVDTQFIEVLVDSIEDTIDKAFARGGKVIMAKKPMSKLNNFAIIQDFEGNIIGLWEDVSP